MIISKNYSIKQIVVTGNNKIEPTDVNWTPNLFSVYGPINYIKSIKIMGPVGTKIILNNEPNDSVAGDAANYFILGPKGFFLKVEYEAQFTNLNVDVCSIGAGNKLIIDLVVYDEVNSEESINISYVGTDLDKEE